MYWKKDGRNSLRVYYLLKIMLQGRATFDSSTKILWVVGQEKQMLPLGKIKHQKKREIYIYIYIYTHNSCAVVFAIKRNGPSFTDMSFSLQATEDMLIRYDRVREPSNLLTSTLGLRFRIGIKHSRVSNWIWVFTGPTLWLLKNTTTMMKNLDLLKIFVNFCIKYLQCDHIMFSSTTVHVI